MDLRDVGRGREFSGALDGDDLTRLRGHAIANAGCGRDQTHIEFPLQALLDDLHVQQAEKSAAETEAQGQ